MQNVFRKPKTEQTSYWNAKRLSQTKKRIDKLLECKTSFANQKTNRQATGMQNADGEEEEMRKV
jgi:hypothetical protein